MWGVLGNVESVEARGIGVHSTEEAGDRAGRGRVRSIPRDNAKRIEESQLSSVWYQSEALCDETRQQGEVSMALTDIIGSAAIH